MNPSDLPDWLAARLPAELLAAPPEVRAYPDELLVILALAVAPDTAPSAIAQLREATRPLRVRLAREIQRALGLPVAWGMRSGAYEQLFTTRSAPVMTRLGRAERELLDTLVAVGVAETRSAALAYVVRAFAIEHADWLAEAQQSIVALEQVRARLSHAPRRGAPLAAADHAAPETTAAGSGQRPEPAAAEE